MPDSIEHIALQVSDIRAATSWYSSSFNCEILHQDDKEAILQFANIKLQLVLPSQVPNHLAFSRDDADTFGELRHNRDGSSSCFVADPTGNLVEILDLSKLESKK